MCSSVKYIGRVNTESTYHQLRQICWNCLDRNEWKKKKYSSTFFPVLRSQIRDRIRRKKLCRPRQNVSLSMHRIFSIIDNRYSMVSRRNRRVCGFVAASSARERVPTCISLLRHDPRDLSVERNDRWIDKFVTGGCGGKTVLTIFLR